METTGAEILVESLKSVGVKVIFGVSGSPTLSVLDVLHRTPEIRYIQAQHEQNAMYMANGYARQAREVGICLVSSGPAETNCVSGVAQAYYTSTPSILLASVEGSKFIGLGPSIHHDVDSPRVFAPVTKLAVRVERKDRLQEILQRALVTAMAGRKGPCFVGIPKDFLKEKLEVDQPGLQLHRPQPPRGNAQDIEAVAALLEEAKRPFILVGGGINWAGAHRELVQLAELLHIPVANTKGHTGIFPGDHPLSLGTFRPDCTPPTMQAYKEADLIVCIGCSFAYCVDTGFGVPVPKTAKIVHIDIDPAEIGKVVPVQAAVVGDAKLVLQDLLEVLKERGRLDRRHEKETEWSQELARRKAAWAERILPLQTSNRVPIQTYRLMSDLRKALPRNAVVAGDSGGTGTWFDHCFQGLVPNPIGGWHPLGAEFCEALGVKVASPEIPVVCVTGDGSMMMSVQEWATAVAYNIPIVCVVQHNGVFGNMHYEQIARYGGRFLGTDLPIPNLTNVAREFGAHAERVEAPDQIMPAVRRALESGTPALLEVMVDSSAENLVPPKNRSIT